MPAFSQTSLDRINTCHPALQKLMHHIIRSIDISILEGYRSQERQLELYDLRKTKVLRSKHNHKILHNDVSTPWSLAIDIAPYPIDFGKTPKEVLATYLDTQMTAQRTAKLATEINKAMQALARFYYLGAFVKQEADRLNIPLRWGGDWDNDHDLFDQTFYDLVHFELVGLEDRPHYTGTYGYEADA
jgi:hypothetical protein